jgi:hypothetical protein
MYDIHTYNIKMSLEKLYSINSELNSMFGGEAGCDNTVVWIIISFIILAVVVIILYLSGILSFHRPNFIGTHVDNNSTNPTPIVQSVTPNVASQPVITSAYKPHK